MHRRVPSAHAHLYIEMAGGQIEYTCGKYGKITAGEVVVVVVVVVAVVVVVVISTSHYT